MFGIDFFPEALVLIFRKTEQYAVRIITLVGITISCSEASVKEIGKKKDCKSIDWT